MKYECFQKIDLFFLNRVEVRIRKKFIEDNGRNYLEVWTGFDYIFFLWFLSCFWKRGSEKWVLWLKIRKVEIGRKISMSWDWGPKLLEAKLSGASFSTVLLPLWTFIWTSTTTPVIDPISIFKRQHPTVFWYNKHFKNY